MIAVDVLIQIRRRVEGKLAHKRAVVFVNDRVVEALWIPVGAERVPETRLHDVDAVLALHLLIVSSDGELLRSRCELCIGEESAAC